MFKISSKDIFLHNRHKRTCIVGEMVHNKKINYFNNTYKLSFFTRLFAAIKGLFNG